MKILVTGGAGYIGSHCVRELCQAGHEVVVFDNLRDGGHQEAVDRRSTLVVGDLADKNEIAAALQNQGSEAVMHFAGSLNVGESVTEPLAYYRNNIANTLNLLECVRDAGVRKMVFSSTCATYGEPESMPMKEELTQAPINPYGRTKLAIEWALQDCAGAWGLGSTALRYFNASGASSDATIGEDRSPEYHLVPLVLQVALGQRDHIKIFGTDYPTADGTCVRDYVHVEDLARAHRSAIERSQAGTFRAFNLGVGKGTSVKELIEVARKVTGHKIPATESGRRPGDPPELYADPSKANRELDWQPVHNDIESIVASAWAWHKSHPNGYANG